MSPLYFHEENMPENGINIITKNDLNKYEQQIKATSKPAAIFQIGGFKSPKNIKSSWFGKVLVGKKGEEWPESNGKPMIPLCQLDVSDLPYKPENIKDIEFISVFVGGERDLPCDHEPNGTKWCLRTYNKLDQLIPITQPNYNSSIKPIPIRPSGVVKDYPSIVESPLNILFEHDDSYLDKYPNHEGIKFGGYPALIQYNEIFDLKNYTSNPQYIFLIDSIKEANWMWGDIGVGYFGIGTDKNGNDVWSLEWECY